MTAASYCPKRQVSDLRDVPRDPFGRLYDLADLNERQVGCRLSTLDARHSLPAAPPATTPTPAATRSLRLESLALLFPSLPVLRLLIQLLSLAASLGM